MSFSVSICIATYGEESWNEMAWKRAYPSAYQQAETLCFHDPEGTIASVRNELGATAKSDWLCFLDADDELAVGYIAAMQIAVESDPWSGTPGLATARRGVAGQDKARHGSGGQAPPLFTPSVQQLRKNGTPRGKPSFFDRGIPLSDDNWLVVETLIQRDLFMQVGGFSDYPHGFEDWSCWAKAWKAGATVVKVPDAIYRYWIDPRSKHKLGWKNREWQVAMHNQIRAELFPELV